MNKIPKIKVGLDKERDKNLFIKFLNHPFFPQHRNLILKVFPKLKNLLENLEEGKAVDNFVDDFYNSHQKRILKIIKENEIEAGKKAEKALRKLGKVMDYEWKKPITYSAKATILPFSPYKDNTFYFSILAQLRGKQAKDLIEISLHEISHFIFSEQLKELNIILEESTKYCFKEALTAAILNQIGFKSPANPGVRELKVRFKDKNYELVDFISELLKEKGYKKALREALNLINKSSDKFSQKLSLWNKYGKDIIKDKEALKRLREPIKL